MNFSSNYWFLVLILSIPTLTYQCITVHQRTACYPFMHYSVLFLRTFSVFHCDDLFFYVALFSYCTISMFHFFVQWSFHAALFFALHSFYVLHYFMLHFYLLQCFRFAFFSCWTLFFQCHTIFTCFTLFMSHCCQSCSQEPHKHLRWRALQHK